MATPNFPKVDGTTGNDYLIAPAPTGAYDYAGLGGDDTIAAAAGSDLIYGDNRDGTGVGNDSISGGGGNDTIYGGYGQDTIYGDDGNDLIYGDSDIPDVVLGQYSGDSIVGGSGDDTIHGQYGNDTIFGGDGKDEIYGDGDDDYIDGGDGNDRIDGGYGNDTLLGGEGKDSLYGGEGNDLLVGSSGADLLDGGEGNDIVTYQLSSSGITLNLLDPTQNTGDATGDTYVSIEAFMGSNYEDLLRAGTDGAALYGLNGDDSLYGNIGNDYLNGGEGTDLLQGGPGDDTLVGGLGDDIYAFTSGEGITRIVELADQGFDYMFVGSNIDGLSLGRAGNNLVFFANDGADVAIFDSWFLYQGVEAIYLQSTGYLYDVAALVENYIPSDSSAENGIASLAANDAPDFSQSVQIDFSEIPTIDVAGLAPCDIPVLA